jgi:EAL domain-containing protein (putative c-di-GMP-specific phosphodiesterase class I)
LAIGEWVFREGCRQMALWVDQHPLRAPAVMSLNMSRKQFKQRDLSKVVGEIVAESGVPAERVQVEITEDMYEGDMEAAIRTMRELKAIGLRLAIDDFGVGSSTFAAVNQFPIDVLKVDRSLVSDTANSADSAAIVHSLAVLVRNLDVKLVAEGVEDQQQMLALQDLGCQYAQGYLFGRPMSAQGIEDFFVRPQAAMEMTASGASAFGNSWENRLAAFQRLELEEAAGTRRSEERSLKSGAWSK